MTRGGWFVPVLVVAALASGCRATMPPRELTPSSAPVPPGTYTRSTFRPAITLELREGWTPVNGFDDFFDVQKDVGSPDVIAVQIARPGGFVGRSSVQRVSTPREAHAVLSENPGLTIGGLDGKAFEVENRSGEHVGVLALGPGTLGIDPGRKLRIACFSTPQGLIAVMVGGSVAKWREAVAAAEPIVASIRFTP